MDEGRVVRTGLVILDDDILTLPNIRCFTCGKVLLQRYHNAFHNAYKATGSHQEAVSVLVGIGVKRICCIQNISAPSVITPVIRGRKVGGKTYFSDTPAPGIPREYLCR
jgi:DNA-directed RNA polymerase subunit N (RpoN/RPB10)